MGTGYTRNDTSNNIADGNIINAADLDGEFDAIESALGTSGHTHDGTSAEGGPVTVLGPVQDFVASATEIKPKTTNTLSIGTNSLLFKDMFLDGVATIGSIKIDNAGTIGSASDADAIAISSGGVVTFSQAVSNLGNVTGKTSSGFVLALQTSDTTIEATNVLGKIEFSAPDEASGTDAILVGASIEALAEDTFSSSVNSSALVFKTNTTGAATERMRLTSAGDLHFLDNRKAIFGAGSDLQIYHDGNHSYINNTTGYLHIASANIEFKNAANNETMLLGTQDGAVTLYHDNALKLATTSTGVDITGTLTSDGLTVDGDTNSDPSLAHFYNINTGTAAEATAYITNSATKADGLFLQQLGSSFTTAGGFVQDGSTIGSGTGASGGLSIMTRAAADMRFYTNGHTNERMRITSTGLVGIGTDSPTTALTVSTDGTEQLTINRADASINAGNTIGTILFTGDDPSANQTGARMQVIAAQNWSSNAYGSHITFSNDSSGTLTERMRIDNSGNVGIGTSSPATKLDFGITTNDTQIVNLRKNGNSIAGLGVNAEYGVRIAGPSDAAAPVSFGEISVGDGTTFSEFMRIDSSGHVGIGRSNPLHPLHIGDTSGNTVLELQRTNTNTSGSVGAISFTASDDHSVAAIHASGDGDNEGAHLIFRTTSAASENNYFNSTSERMRIDSSGNVGIGTSSPATGLHVNGSDNLSSSLTLQNTAPSPDNIWRITPLYNSGDLAVFDDGTERMRIDSSGRVGIGVTPEAWGTAFPSVLQIGAAASLTTSGGDNARLFGNVYHDGSYKRITSGFAHQYEQTGGTHRWAYAATGAADSTISFSEAMRIDSSGNLLVATTNTSLYNNASDDYGFVISSSGTYQQSANNTVLAYYNRQNGDGDIMEFRKDGTTVGSIGTKDGFLYIEKGDAGLTFDNTNNRIFPSNDGSASDNNLDLGHSSARFKDLYLSSSIDIDAASGARIKFTDTGTQAYTIGNTGTSFNIYNESQSSEAMRIDSSGHLLVGKTSSAFGTEGIELQSDGELIATKNGTPIYVNRITTDGAVQNFYKDGSAVGSISVTGSATAYNTSSDHRLKENVVELTGATDRFKQLEPKRFNFIADADTTVDGFLAHEVQSVVPEAITGTHNEVDADDNPVYQGIDQSKLVPLLVATIKELEARITALENA